MRLMRNNKVCFLINLLVLIFLITAIPVGADVMIQCPKDTDGIDTDGDGDPNNDYVCMHLAAGDGFVNMADAQRKLQYIFGFADVTDVPEDKVVHRAMLAAIFLHLPLNLKKAKDSISP